MTKHHATLGLARLDATPEEIHAAYIALAKVRHPDRGGDPEAFRAISEAYAALRDDKEKDEEDSFAHSLVARMMGQALDQVGDGAIYADPVEAMIKACTQALAEIDKSVANMRRKVVRYSKFANRFGTKDGGDNVLRAMVDASIAQIESQIEAATLFKERHEKARALLERHSFDVDGETAQARLMNRLGY